MRGKLLAGVAFGAGLLACACAQAADDKLTESGALGTLGKLTEADELERRIAALEARQP